MAANHNTCAEVSLNKAMKRMAIMRELSTASGAARKNDVQIDFNPLIARFFVGGGHGTSLGNPVVTAKVNTDAAVAGAANLLKVGLDVISSRETSVCILSTGTAGGGHHRVMYKSADKWVVEPNADGTKFDLTDASGNINSESGRVKQLFLGDGNVAITPVSDPELLHTFVDYVEQHRRSVPATFPEKEDVQFTEANLRQVLVSSRCKESVDSLIQGLRDSGLVFPFSYTQFDDASQTYCEAGFINQEDALVPRVEVADQLYRLYQRDGQEAALADSVFEQYTSRQLAKNELQTKVESSFHIDGYANLDCQMAEKTKTNWQMWRSAGRGEVLGSGDREKSPYTFTASRANGGSTIEYTIKADKDKHVTSVKLPKILAGKDEPFNPVEKEEVARLCQLADKLNAEPGGGEKVRFHGTYSKEFFEAAKEHVTEDCTDNSTGREIVDLSALTEKLKELFSGHGKPDAIIKDEAGKQYEINDEGDLKEKAVEAESAHAPAR